MQNKRLAVAGNGYLANIVVDAYRQGLLEGYELTGILKRSDRQEGTEVPGCKACHSLEELLELKPDYVVEAASVQLVKDIAIPVLESGANLVVLSIGAFADQEFYERVQKTARANDTKVHIASGAIGGFDVLRTVALMGKVTSGIETRKGPGSLRGTPVFEDHLMTDTEETHVFSGNAREAIGLFPTKVNVAVAAALATAGVENTSVNIHSIPGMVGDDHKITAEIEGVKAVVDIYSSTSAIAGWSVVALLRNLVSPIMF